jgi:hypothetical protein
LGGILLPGFVKDFVYGLVVGTLFYQRSVDDHASKVSLAFIGSTALCFANMSEVTLANEAKRIVQNANGFRSVWSGSIRRCAGGCTPPIVSARNRVFLSPGVFSQWIRSDSSGVLVLFSGSFLLQ